MMDHIVKTAEIGAPIDRVWRALTDHTEFGAWFRVRLDGPFVLGEVTSGQVTYPGAEHVKWWSKTVRMEEPHVLAFLWPHDENAQRPPDFDRDPVTLVEFRLEAVGGATRLTVTESGFASLPEDKRMTRLRDNEKGWEEQVKNIQAYVES